MSNNNNNNNQIGGSGGIGVGASTTGKRLSKGSPTTTTTSSTTTTTTSSSSLPSPSSTSSTLSNDELLQQQQLQQQRQQQLLLELHRKQLTVKQLIEWLLRVTIDNDHLYPSLRDGRILCKLMNRFHQPADYIHFSDFEPLQHFKQKENIVLFLKKCRLYVPEELVFQPNDLLESANMPLVLDCLLALFDYFQEFIKNDLYNTGAPEYYYNPNGGIHYMFPTTDQSNNMDNNNMDNSLPELVEQYQQYYNNNNNNETMYQQDSMMTPKKGINGYILDAIIVSRDYILAPFLISVALGFGIKLSRTAFVKVSALLARHCSTSSTTTAASTLLQDTTSLFNTNALLNMLDSFKQYIHQFIDKALVATSSSSTTGAITSSS
ncbi:hypothetical protein SAMD00019534_038970 [Acytostelium subglobosum LB1]|uniref:hypothetical protein n=1 Tax=Acytostelium subglobosum LB1 TaxID=1410327 RepID=UPI000644FA51|nr:hypothetical protein SAMD00019534_038970 [Acytostelium subglobosum LB1]GAM20722.1 hypothetical protein SAMD00019534_038970 [Acytostelium subglobosum LB1]|eukprot:XP_012755856.1 hypothetical protein SAMD00019534_038970 [Acytostelium subglobosum LB1]